MGTAKQLKSLDEWEREIAAHAALFTVVRFLGRGKRERHEYRPDQFAEALAHARQKVVGQPFAIYAVSAEGRSVCLERSKDDLWVELCQK
jgi:hypothetical protein